MSNGRSGILTKISKILSDRVVVERGGAEEVLIISHERGAAPRSLAPAGRQFVRPPKATQRVSKRPVRSRVSPVRRIVRPVKPVEPEEVEKLEEPEEPEESVKPEESEELDAAEESNERDS